MLVVAVAGTKLRGWRPGKIYINVVDGELHSNSLVGS